MRYGIFTM